VSPVGQLFAVPAELRLPFDPTRRHDDWPIMRTS